MSHNEPPSGGNAPDPGQPYQPQQTPGQFGSPDSGAWQGQPPGNQPPGYPPSSNTPGYPPQGNPPGYPPQGNPSGNQPPGYQPSGPPPGWQQPPPGYGAGAGPQAPYGAPGGYGPQQPWGTPPPQQPSGRPNKVVLGAVGGVVGLALIGVGFWAVRGNGGTAAPSPQPTVVATGGTGQTSQPNPPNVPATKASDAVATYLQALAAGDALTALSLAATPPSGNTAFLTNGVLAKATAGKISDVTVPEVADPNASSVSATYTLAGKPVSASFAVTRSGGQFRLTQVAAMVDLSRLQQSLVPVSLAGVPAKNSVVQLFPGVYPVAATNKRLSYGSAKVTVTDLDDQIAGGGSVSISSAGKAAIIKAVKAKYKSCLRQHSAKPSGCGYGVRIPGGVKVRTSTIKWTTRSGAKWSNLKLKLINTSLVEGRGKAKVHFYARDARVSGRYWFKDINLTGMQANISGSKITVTFY